jgi:hypothetical protein
MSKADDLRKKMNNRVTAQTFTPRASVSVQPIAPPEAKPVQTAPKTAKIVSKVITAKQPKPKQAEADSEELVALYAKVPAAEKRWLDHYRIDQGKDLGEVVSQAIALLKKHAENG